MSHVDVSDSEASPLVERVLQALSAAEHVGLLEPLAARPGSTRDRSISSIFIINIDLLYAVAVLLLIRTTRCTKITHVTFKTNAMRLR